VFEIGVKSKFLFGFSYFCESSQSIHLFCPHLPINTTLNTFALTSLVTLLVVLLMLVNAVMVGRARGQYQIKAPAVSGHEQFERTYRVQMNTIENVLLFLPAMWVYAFYLGDTGAASTGLIWLIGRILYAAAYTSNPSKRGPGFAISMLAVLGAWLGGLYGVLRILLS